jgi:hypothetical protein
LIVVIHYIVFILLFLLLARWIIRKNFLQAGLANQYLFIGGISSLLIVASLAYLSLTNAPYAAGGPRDWTYLQESRYFAFPFFFCQQILVIVFYHFRHKLRKWTIRLIILVFIIASIDFLHNIYFTVKAFINEQKKLNINLTTEGLTGYVNGMVNKLEVENPGKKIVVVAEPAFVGSQAGIYKTVPALYQYTPMQNTVMKTSKMVFVLFITDDEQKMPVTFTANPTKKLAGLFKKYSFYSIHVKPTDP